MMNHAESQDYKPAELLICTASRLMLDNTTAFIGTGIPMLAASLAQRSDRCNGHLRCDGDRPTRLH
jgi:acyl CoA:acetate/3-ketoacid CoA transferase beta subunit